MAARVCNECGKSFKKGGTPRGPWGNSSPAYCRKHAKKCDALGCTHAARMYDSPYCGRHGCRQCGEDHEGGVCVYVQMLQGIKSVIDVLKNYIPDCPHPGCMNCLDGIGPCYRHACRLCLGYNRPPVYDCQKHPLCRDCGIVRVQPSSGWIYEPEYQRVGVCFECKCPYYGKCMNNRGYVGNSESCPLPRSECPGHLCPMAPACQNRVYGRGRCSVCIRTHTYCNGINPCVITICCCHYSDDD